MLGGGGEGGELRLIHRIKKEGRGYRNEEDIPP